MMIKGQNVNWGWVLSFIVLVVESRLELGMVSWKLPDTTDPAGSPSSIAPKANLVWEVKLDQHGRIRRKDQLSIEDWKCTQPDQAWGVNLSPGKYCMYHNQTRGSLQFLELAIGTEDF